MVLGWEIDWKLLKTLQKGQGIGFACHNLVFGLRSVRPRHTLLLAVFLRYERQVVRCLERVPQEEVEPLRLTAADVSQQTGLREIVQHN